MKLFCELTAAEAQKIADVALAKKCENYANIIVETALETIGALSLEGRYSAYYDVYARGNIVKEKPYNSMTSEMYKTTEAKVIDRLGKLGYTVEFSYHGRARMIEISWKKEDKKI